MKRCKTCRGVKKYNQFQKSELSKDGYMTNCSLCFGAIKNYREQKAEREKRGDEINAYIMENLKVFDGKLKLGIAEHKAMAVNKFMTIQ